MASFSPSKKQASDFNNGVEYVNGKNTVNANDINNLVEAVLYAQEVNNQQDYQGLPIGGDIGDILVKQGAENYNVAWSDILTKLNAIVNQNSSTLLSLSQLVETDEDGNTYVYSANRLCRMMLKGDGSDDFWHIQFRKDENSQWKTVIFYEVSSGYLYVYGSDSNGNTWNRFSVDDESLRYYSDYDGEGTLIFQANEDGVFHRGDILLKHKDIESLEDKVDENALKSHTNQLEITNLKNALYGSVLSLETDSNADLDKAILSDSVTVGEEVYPIVDNTRALLSEVSGKTVKFNQLIHRPYYTNKTIANGGVTYTLNDDNNDLTIIANGTTHSTTNNYSFLELSYGSSASGIDMSDITIGHKILIKGSASGSTNATYSIFATGPGYIPEKGVIYTVGENFTGYMRIQIFNGTTVENLVFKPQLYDLTAMGLDYITTVEEFNALFPEEMYEYDSGSLKNAEISGVKLYETDGVTLSAEITLPSEQTLNGVNDIKDKLVVTKNEDNDYYTLKRVNYTGIQVFDGTEDWSESATANTVARSRFILRNVFDFKGKNQTTKANLICNYYTTVTANETYQGVEGISSFNEITSHIYIYDTDIATVADFKAYLAEQYANGTPVEIVYELATPTEEVISSTLTLEQVSTMRRNGGLIEVVGNDNASYGAKPTVDLTVICEQPAKYVPVSGNETEY